MNTNYNLLEIAKSNTEILLFITSFIFCLIPKNIRKYDNLRKVFPIITIVSAGFLLSVLLLDFIPHMLHDHHSHDHDKDHKSVVAGMMSAGLSLLFLIGVDQCIINHDHCETSGHSHEHDVHECEKGNEERSIEINAGSCNANEGQQNDEGIGCCNTKMLKNTRSNTQALIYIASISIHSFFEGLAFKKNDTLGSFEMGIFAHKILESFAIGVTLFNSALSFSTCILLNLFYSMLTPLGIYIAHSYAEKSYDIFDTPLSVYFNGLALGALMFVVFMEMIPGAFHKTGNRFVKFIGLLLGFVGSSIVISLTHSH